MYNIQTSLTEFWFCSWKKKTRPCCLTAKCKLSSN